MEALTAEDPPVIGGYELRARLGAGGFGQVYLGLSAGGRAVAVKVLQGELARDREFLSRFRLEVAAAQRVNGIYTASVVGSGLDDRPPWVATAFVPGPSLASVISRHGPLTQPALWRLLAGLVEALQAIHGCGLVHRDLKPANVMMAADGPRVIDFGISKAADGTALTATGAVFGTPDYMAPEQAEAKEVSPATDVFALGATLAYAATGVLPFGGGSAPSVLYRVVHGSPALDGVPPQLRAVVEACLAKDPPARPRLADLAAIGRDGPGGGSGRSPAAFWPPQVARLIRDYEDQLDAGTQGGWAYGDAAPVMPVPAYQGAGTPRGLVAYPPGQSGTPVRQPAARVALSAVPGTVRTAVILMRVGAGISAVGLLVASGVSAKAAVTAAASTSQSSPAGLSLLFMATAIALWLVVADMTKRGRGASRVIGAVALGALTAILIVVFAWAPVRVALGGTGTSQSYGVADMLVLMWLIGCPAVVLLWLRSSTAYFRASRTGA